MAGSNRRSKAEAPRKPAKGTGGASLRRAGKSAARPSARARSTKPCAFVKGKLHCVIASDFKAGRDVQELIISEAERLDYTPQSIFALRLALEEVLINAIKHGNRFDRDKVVHVDVTMTPTKADIAIEDEGPGFHRSKVPDPRLEENLERCSGRGILLIEAYMTHVEYARGGRRIRMIKINEPQAPLG